MTNCFALVRDYLIKSGVAQIYPSFLRELDCYENYFATHDLISRSFVCNKCGEVFQAIINWNGPSLFSLEWDISGIIDGLQETRFKTTKISKSFKQLFFDERKVEKSKVLDIINTPDTEREPILLVWIAFINMFCVIDGNHRYTAFCHSKQETIDAIIIPAGFHLKYMLSEESRMRYKVFHNIAIMQTIIQHPRCTVSEGMDDRNSLYPISGNKIRVSSFQYVLFYSKFVFLKWRKLFAEARMRGI